MATLIFRKELAVGALRLTPACDSVLCTDVERCLLDDPSGRLTCPDTSNIWAEFAPLQALLYAAFGHKNISFPDTALH